MRLFRLNLALAAGLTASGVPAAGHEVVRDGQSQAADLALEQQVEQPPAEVEPQAPAPVDPAPLPQTLDDLIPQSAVEDAENWAIRGTSDTSGTASPADPAVEAVETVGRVPLSAPAQSDALFDIPFDINAALDTFDIPAITPLERGPDSPTFAEIDAPDLLELEELVELDISDELVLAFPANLSGFPEEDKFVSRFRALSSVEALESDEDTIPQLAARARSDEALLDEILRTYGYYNGEVIRQLSGGRRGFADQEQNDARRPVDTDPKVRFDILPGARYSFGAIDLGALDQLPAPDGALLRGVFGIQPGDPLYADRISAQEVDLRVALGENGYPFAELGDPSLLIDHAREEGDLTLPVDTNGKFVFGEIVSDDPDFLSNRHLQRIARFDPGDTYQTSLQADLRRAILATGLVSSVSIAPRNAEAPSDSEPGEVALDVELERAPLRTVSGAIGYGTEDGFKLEAAWEHRNFFPPEGALRFRGIVGTREQLTSITYRRNNFRDRDQILTVDAYASDIETEAVDARTVALRTSFERVSNLLFQKPLSWQVGAQVLYSDERNRITNGVQRPRQTYLIGGLFGSATLDSSDDLLDPKSGYRLTGFAAPEYSRSLGQETYYVRAQVDASYYQPVGSTVIAGRVRAATILGAQAFEIAPSRRLYSGGGGSVRGYGFQGIGPTDQFDEPVGGGSLVEAAIEARIQTGFLDGAVEVVPFIDAGSVASRSRPDFRSIQVGAGVGVRYKTSFGPIRVDVGVPLNPQANDAPVVVYVSLGQAF